MNIVTHGLAGALVARAVAERAPWPKVAAAVGGALVPDLDVDHPFGGPMALRIRLNRSGAVGAIELGHRL